MHDKTTKTEISTALVIYDPKANGSQQVQKDGFEWRKLTSSKKLKIDDDIFALFRSISYLSYLPKDRTPSGESPNLMEFIQRGYLVHVGNIEFWDDYKDKLVVRLRDKPCSYWTLNDVVHADYFKNFLESKHTIITPLVKHIHNIVNISFPEVMIMGEVELGEGDIVLTNSKRSDLNILHTDLKGVVTFKPNIEKINEIRKKYAQKGIKLVLYEAELDGYQEKNMNARRGAVRQIITELGGWCVDVPNGFWLPTTVAKVEGKEAHPLKFFDALVDYQPALSIGSEFHSIR